MQMNFNLSPDIEKKKFSKILPIY